MTKSFIAAVLAISIGITGITVAPAKADTEDVAKVLLGLALIAGIAAAVDNNNDQDVVTRRTPRRDHDRRVIRRNRVLPQACLRSFETDRGTRWGFGARCLNRRAGNIDLPSQCQRQGWAQNGRQRTFYGERCMARRGFQTARY